MKKRRVQTQSSTEMLETNDTDNPNNTRCGKF